MSLLSSLLAPPVVHQVVGARSINHEDEMLGRGKRAEVYGKAKGLTLTALRKFGPTTADNLARDAFLNPYTVRKVLNALAEEGAAELVEPAVRGHTRSAALWKAT